MRTRFTRLMLVMFFVSLMLTWPSSSVAITAQDYVGIRILEPPDPPAPEDLGICIAPDGPCTLIGPAYGAGISDAGDVFGAYMNNERQDADRSDGIRWMRQDGYKGDNMGKFALDPSWMNEDGSPIPFNTTQGVRTQWVSPGGFATGNGNPGELFYVDIVNREYTVLGDGRGEKASGSKVPGRGRIRFETGVVNYVRDASLVEPPFRLEDTGQIATLGQGFDVFAINSFDVIIGRQEGNPIRIMPTGENEWGDPIAMNEIGPAFGQGEALDLSNTQPGFAVGTSLSRGAVWNTDTGEVVADLGAFHLPHRINSTGDMAVGTRRITVVDPTEPVIFWTEDQWQTVNELTLREILDVVPGGEHWEKVTVLTFPDAPGNLGRSSPQGINKHGQIVAVGTLKEGAPIEELTDWPRSYAIGDECPYVEYPCGIPFILDTLALEVGVLKGDVNNDSVVDFIDITPFINAQSAEGVEAAFLLLTPGGCFLCADIDMDGAIDFLDITPFVNLLDQAAAAAVPEPASAILLILGLVSLGRRRHGCRSRR